jgi:tetratricopeptide (TPR) repeat protein
MRKPTPSARVRLEDLSTRDLIARGQTLISTCDYKDAIDVYKLLLKREPQGNWRESLATAYLERAKELAGKAMYREAIVLWENIPSLCHQTPPPDLYVGWLLHIGQYAKAMTAYTRYATALSGASELETLIATLAIIGQKEVLQVLLPDAPLRRQLAAAQAALAAYSQGKAESVVREALQLLPIRSPYRDLRQIIAALMKLETDPAAAAALVERITPNSPYQGLAEIVRACAAEEPIPALLKLDPAQRELAAQLLGLDSRQSKLVKDWAKLGDASDPKAVFGFITSNLAAFDRELARRACLTLLPGYLQGQPGYAKLFGPLPAFEVCRLQALREERGHGYDQVLRHWRTCANELAKDAGNPDGRLMAALVLRHMAEYAGHDEDSFWDDESSVTASYLEESLQLDPSDRDTYLKLAVLYQKAGNDKDYHRWVDQAVKQFPDDPLTLMAAVKTATARKAYKKAAGFAERVLELDPINTQARIVLINSHLAHARKQILAGKYELAIKELNSASQLERDNARSGVVEIDRGLLAHRQRQREPMRQWLQEGVRLAGSPLLARLRLTVEATRLKLEPTPLLREAELGDPRNLIVSRADLQSLIQLLNVYQEAGVDDLGSALEDLEKPLKQAIKQLDNREDLLSICECLHQVPHYELLEYAATQAIDRQFRPPPLIFIYHQIYGRAEGVILKVKERDERRLENAFETAQQTGDHRTGLRIGRFLDGGEDGFRLPFRRPSGNRGSTGLPINVPKAMRVDLLDGIEEIRQELNRVPPALRKIAMERIIDDFPLHDDLPPEMQRGLIRMLLSGHMELGGSDNEPDFPFPLPRGRGGRRS